MEKENFLKKYKNPSKILDAIEAVVDYAIEDERDHWEENDKPRNHIYHSLKTLDKFLSDIKHK